MIIRQVGFAPVARQGEATTVDSPVLTDKLLGRQVHRLMLTSVQFATKLFVAVVGVYVRPLTIVCIHFFAIGCFATETDTIELLCSVCGQVLCSVRFLAV